MKGLAVLGALAALSPGLALKVDQGERSRGRRHGSSREPKLLFSTFYWRSEFDQLSATLRSLQATVEAQAIKISTLEMAASGGSDASTTYTNTIQAAIFSNITDVYSKLQQNRKDIDKKCPRTKCDKILKKVKKVKALVEFIQTTNITVLESLVEMLKEGSDLTALVPIKACMEDPTATACTSTYSGSSTLPGALASAQTSITAAQTSITALETCMQTPTATGCTSGNTNGASGSLPAITATAITDLSVVKECFTDPTAAACTYTATASLPVVLAAKCTSTTCTALQTSIDALDTCMKTPTDASCTGSTIGSPTTSLPSKVALLDSCMTTPEDAACTIKATTTSVPYKVTNLDKCMESIDDTTCAASYGATSKFISSGGKGMVAWVQQLRKPSTVTCNMGETALTFPNYNAAAKETLTTPVCAVAKVYEKITWASCTSTDQPDNSNQQTYHMEANTAKDEVTINKAGTYRIGLTALMTTRDGKQLRTEVYKISSKDPTTSSRCGAVTSACTTLMQLRVQSDYLKTTPAGTITADNTGERTTTGEGVFSLCDGDRIFVIASKGGNAASTNSEITITEEGTGTEGIRTRFTITKIGWLDGTP